MPEPYYQLRMFRASPHYGNQYLRIDLRYEIDDGRPTTREHDNVMTWWIYKAHPEQIRVLVDKPFRASSDDDRPAQNLYPTIPAAIWLEVTHYLTNPVDWLAEFTDDTFGVKHYV